MMNQAAQEKIASLIRQAGLSHTEVGDWTITPKEVAYVLTCELAGGTAMAIPALKAIHASKSVSV